MMNLELMSQSLQRHNQPSRKSLSAIGKPHPKNKFTEQEDFQLKQIVQTYGDKDWELVARIMGTRNARQCRERYTNYLSPEIRNDPWSDDEDRTLIEKFNEFGAKWVKISKFFPNRTDSQLKNRWQVLKRKGKMLHQLNKQSIITLNESVQKSQNQITIPMLNQSYPVQTQNVQSAQSPITAVNQSEPVPDTAKIFSSSEQDPISTSLIDSFAPLDVYEDQFNDWLLF